MIRRPLSAALVLLAIGFAPAFAAAAATSAQPADRTASAAFAVGRMLMLEGQYVEALAMLQKAADAAPNDPYPHLEIAALDLRIGRVEDAERQARQALSLGGKDPDVLRAVAEDLLALLDSRPDLLDQARGVLESLLALRPEDPDALQALGRIYLAAGDQQHAEEMFRRLVAAVPDARQASTQLLRLLMQRGKKADAAALLRDQLTREPDALETRLALADLLSDTGDHTGSVAVLKDAPADQLPLADVQRRLAFELYRTGDVAAASALVDRLLATGPDLRLRLFRALLLEEQGKDTEALKELEGLHAELPRDPEVGLSLARMLAREDKRNEARQLLEELLANLAAGGPEQQAVADRVRLELAQLLVDEQRWTEALPVLDQLQARVGSTKATATLLRVDALVGLGKKEQALTELRPDSGLPPPALAAKRAEVLLSLKREDEAAAELAKLPNGAEGKAQAAEVYQRAGHHAQAIPLLLDLLAGDPESTDLRFRLGAAYERTGQTPQAVATFQELLRRSPDNHMALNYLGYMWAEKGQNLPEALKMVQRALELDPGNAAYVDSLGWIYFRLGELPQAIQQLERAAQLLPGDGTVQEHLGDALRAAGKMPEARTAYRRALALGDDNATEVQRKLDDVERGLPPR
jgi:tetratricopeptide (TPR) repeat protein